MRLRFDPPFFALLFPEVELFEDVEQRRSAIFAALVHSTVASLENLRVIAVIGAIVMGLDWVFLPMFVYFKSVRRKVREQVCVMGVPVCVKCGYQLKGISAHRCPECGCESRI